MPDRAKAQLLERDAELSAIDRLIDRTAQGEGAVVVIEGPAGIGKSALIEHTVESADRAAMDYRRARGSELESDYAYGIVRELFESLLAALPADEREHLFSGAARLARPIFPALADQDGAAGDDAFSVLHGLYWLVAGLTERRPLALAIDDAHWADLPSLRLLAYLANRAHELPLLIVIGLRPIEAGPRMRLLDEVAVNSITSNLYPGALGADSVSQLLSGAFGIEPDPGFAAACLEATQGNPFFLRELVTSISAEGIAPVAAEAPRALQIAPSVGRSVVRRLGHLSDDALAVARSIAVLGNAKDASVVAALSELEPAVMTTAADALVRAEILRPDGLEFTHPIVRSAIYSELPPGERAAKHNRAARVLSSSGAADADVALHLLVATPDGDPWTVAVLRRAAVDAGSRGAPDIAATYLERALAEPPAASERGELLHELGLSQAVVRGPEGLARLRQSMEVADDSKRRAEIALELGRLLFMQSFFPESAEVLERTLEELDGDHAELGRQIEAQLFIVALADLALLSRLGGLERLAGRIRASDCTGDPAALAALAWIEAVAVPPAANGARLATEALAGLGLSPGGEASILAGAGPALMAANRFEEAKALWDLGAAEARRRGSLAALAFCLVMRAAVEVRLGAPLAAEADANELLTLGRQLDILGEQVSVPYPWLLAPLIDALLERGDIDGAAKAVEDSPVGGELPELLQFNYLLDSLGRLRLAQGRGTEAIGLLRECGRRLTAWGIRNPGLVPWRSSLATALLSVGEREEALALVEEEVGLAHEFEVPRELGMALRVNGLVRGGDEGMARLEEAAGVLMGSQAPLERARALTDLGSALRRRGRRADAREPLREGLAIALRSGAAAVAQRAHSELIASGARPRRLALSGPDALTASERRVAELAARGLTNRQIAESLFITEKTVEGHLSHAYRKLDIGSRTQLSDAFATTGGSGS